VGGEEEQGGGVRLNAMCQVKARQGKEGYKDATKSPWSHLWEAERKGKGEQAFPKGGSTITSECTGALIDWCRDSVD